MSIAPTLMGKKALSETDIRSKFITPAIAGEGSAGWDLMTQIREEVYFTNGRVITGSEKVRHGETKVDQLMAFVDQLEAQLEQTRSTATNLLTAIVAVLTTTSRKT